MSWYEDERRADLRWAEPADFERICGECTLCHDIGLREHGLCVGKYEDTHDYDDMQLVGFGDDASGCEAWRTH